MKYLKHLALVTLGLLSWGSCKAADINLSCPADSVQVICPQTISTSTPSPLQWGSTQTFTAPITLNGSVYPASNGQLTATVPNGAAPGSLDGVNLLDATSDGNAGGQVFIYSDQSLAVLRMDSFATGAGMDSVLMLRTAEGTKAVPQATASGDAGGLVFGGYNGSAFTGSKARVILSAADNWTGTDNATFIDFATTGIGSTSVTARVRVEADGGIRPFKRTTAQLLAIAPIETGEEFFCTDCSPAKIVVATGTSAGNFSDAIGGTFK